MEEAPAQFDLEVVEGEAVYRLLDKSQFITSWAGLGQTDPKWSVIQEPPFATTWYRQYSNQYTPVLCLAHDQTGSIVGIMPLAVHQHSGQITHAGVHQAEYHGWICRPALEQEFPIACLLEIARKYEPSTWTWNWLPPGAGTDWLSSPRLKKAGIHLDIVSQDSPVHHLGNEKKLAKILKNKSIKAKMNRYIKRRDLYLEQVTEKARAAELMPFIAEQCDFRQEAIKNSTPFAYDPNKAPFHINRMEYPNSNHFTVLWSDDKPLAFHIGSTDGRRVILGLLTFDPSEGKNSPGTLLLIKLLQKLKEDGYETFDLSAGGEEFKERLANEHQTVYAPTFYFSRKAMVTTVARVRSKRFIKRSLLKFDTNETTLNRIKNVATDYKEAFRTGNLGDIIYRLAKSVYENKVVTIFKLDSIEPDDLPEKGPEIRVQRYQDLMKDVKHDRDFSRKRVFGTALDRFADGEVLYSMAVDDTLAIYGWRLLAAPERGKQPLVADFELPSGSVLLHGFYTSPGCDESILFTKCLGRMVDDSLRAGVENIYLLLEKNHTPLHDVVAKMGFTLVVRRQKKRILWWSRLKPSAGPR